MSLFAELVYTRTNFIRAVVLLICLAELTLHTGTDLRAHTHTVSDFYGLDLGANFDCLANDFVANAYGQWALSPAASDGMNVGATDPARVDFNVDVVVFELFWLELYNELVLRAIESWAEFANLFLLEVGPFALILDHKTFESIWVAHICNYPMCLVGL